MRFVPTRIPGVVVVELVPHGDERGFFARAWCREQFAEQGLATGFAQANLAYTAHAGTLRGMHFQRAPHAEAKLVRCIRGSVFDVAVDLREGSPTHGEWVGVELSAANRLTLHVPEGCAHGYQTLTDDSELLYFVTAPYAPAAEGGVRWDDPAFGIEWPQTPSVVSEKDARWPDYEPRPDAGARRTRNTRAASE